jgi:hypothetical protein
MSSGTEPVDGWCRPWAARQEQCGVDGGRNEGYKPRGAILRVLDLEVMPMEQFLLSIQADNVAGLVVALISRKL